MSSWSRNTARAAARSASTCAVAPNWKSINARARSARAARVTSLASPAQAKASSSQRLASTAVPASQCGQLAPPAIVNAVSASSVATAHSSAAAQVVLLLGDGGQPRPLLVADEGRRRSRRRGGRSGRPWRRGPAAASPRSASFSRPYWASVWSWVKRTSAAPGSGVDERLVDERVDDVLDVGGRRGARRRTRPGRWPGRSRRGTPRAARTPAARRRTAGRSSSRRRPAASAGAAARYVTRR